jgi:2,4-dienoyl-CoA reductase-like NADH-dependent reductase (Old Yellow Enzyme family)
MTRFVQVKRLRTLDAFRRRLAELGVADQVGADDEVDPRGPLAQPFTVRDGSAGERLVGNRFAVLPMEGWDGTPDGRPTDLVRRRWRRFGLSGAKLVWGGEAVAVRPDGRANPRQLVIDDAGVPALAELRRALVEAHGQATGRTDDLLVGLQLTHSGRWARPHGDPVPLVARRHAVLDRRAPGGAPHVLTDDELDVLVDDFVAAAVRARDAGFAFVDVKHCHGYLLHELLGAVDRPGRYGGSFEGRTAFLRAVVAGIRDAAPDLAVGVRLSAFDLAPFAAGDDGVGAPVALAGAAEPAFGGDGSGTGVDLTEPHRFLDLCGSLGIGLVCLTAGSPYTTPHVQRPAFFPPSDGYAPPEDPLVGVARLLAATAELGRAHPDLAIVGTGYSYLQQWLPRAAQHDVRTGRTTAVGIGRNMLSYPELPADVLAGRPLRTEQVCRTFSDCTTAPRNGMVSGCYPLDDAYRDRPERIELAAVKKATRRALPR